jgi:hypothetical protein
MTVSWSAASSAAMFRALKLTSGCRLTAATGPQCRLQEKSVAMNGSSDRAAGAVVCPSCCTVETA